MIIADLNFVKPLGDKPVLGGFSAGAFAGSGAFAFGNKAGSTAATTAVVTAVNVVYRSYH